MNLDNWKTVYIYNEQPIGETEFWSSINVWNRKPYLLNKLISGVFLVEKGDHSIGCIENLIETVNSIDFSNVNTYSDYKSLIMKQIEFMKCHNTNICDSGRNDLYTLFVKFLCPRNSGLSINSLEVSFFGRQEPLAVFIKPIKKDENNSGELSLNYGIKYKCNSIQLLVPETVDELCRPLTWLISSVLPTLARWSKIKTGKTTLQSLSLVPMDEYCFLYNHLKKKHSKYLLEIWTEKTDPQKYIFEDIAIATYLILLWKTPMRFVDLGCGNGLLVYLLNSENHLGIGIDVRPRKIWEKYPTSTVLKVSTIMPSQSSLFPDASWIIGNHSDELSPWVPVITARSSYKCNFFLLPCCAYQFNGQKYARTNTSQSTYENYFSYLNDLCTKCGFIVKQDKLKIPSTKRQCIVSFGRTYGENEMCYYDDVISELISQKSDHGSDLNPQKSWVEDFTPRPAKIEVHNCTQLKPGLVESIIDIISKNMLENRPINGSEWFEGKETKISDLVSFLPKNLLVQLKEEHGGLQTLLRNNHQIFIVKNGMSKFRKPQVKPKDSCFVWKKKKCWFYHNHPDSCPLKSEDCSFIH